MTNTMFPELFLSEDDDTCELCGSRRFRGDMKIFRSRHFVLSVLAHRECVDARPLSEGWKDVSATSW